MVVEQKENIYACSPKVGPILHIKSIKSFIKDLKKASSLYQSPYMNMNVHTQGQLEIRIKHKFIRLLISKFMSKVI